LELHYERRVHSNATHRRREQHHQDRGPCPVVMVFVEWPEGDQTSFDLLLMLVERDSEDCSTLTSSRRRVVAAHMHVKDLIEYALTWFQRTNHIRKMSLGL